MSCLFGFHHGVPVSAKRAVWKDMLGGWGEGTAIIYRCRRCGDIYRRYVDYEVTLEELTGKDKS